MELCFARCQLYTEMKKLGTCIQSSTLFSWYIVQHNNTICAIEHSYQSKQKKLLTPEYHVIFCSTAAPWQDSRSAKFYKQCVGAERTKEIYIMTRMKPWPTWIYEVVINYMWFCMSVTQKASGLKWVSDNNMIHKLNAIVLSGLSDIVSISI